MSNLPEDFDQFFTVFDGSSPEDMSHARQLWSSLSLLPPQESRLVSADIRQRLPVSRPSGVSAAAFKPSGRQTQSLTVIGERQEERERYLAMADRRKEILALLRRQREQRIQKERPSAAVKPEAKKDRDQARKSQDALELMMDKEMVRELL